MAAPLHEVGALLEARAVHTGRSRPNHLRAMAATHRPPASRVDEVFEIVGLGGVADRRAAVSPSAWVNDSASRPRCSAIRPLILLDEPVNGLDPEGIQWIRGSDAGPWPPTAVPSSCRSHLMSEMALTAEHLIVIGRGRFIADVAMAEMLGRRSPSVLAWYAPGGQPRAGPGCVRRAFSFQQARSRRCFIDHRKEPIDRNRRASVRPSDRVRELKATHGSPRAPISP